MAEEPIFYVYEPWRMDTGECFYVGKGHGHRARDFGRRKHHHANLLCKLKAGGHKVEVRFFVTGLPEREALNAEVSRIAYWRSQGAPLVNITNGGEGVSGLKHSDETREKLRAANLGKLRGPRSPEVIEKSAAAQRGKKRGPNPEHSARMKGMKWAPEVVAKRASANLGQKRGEQARANMSLAQRGHVVSDEARKNMSLAHQGKPITEKQALAYKSAARFAKLSAAHKGRVVSSGTREKISAAKKGKTLTAEHCAKVSVAIKQWWDSRKSSCN
jgi:hypothetical protein